MWLNYIWGTICAIDFDVTLRNGSFLEAKNAEKEVEDVPMDIDFEIKPPVADEQHDNNSDVSDKESEGANPKKRTLTVFWQFILLLHNIFRQNQLKIRWNVSVWPRISISCYGMLFLLLL